METIYDNSWESNYAGDGLLRHDRQNYRLSRDFLGAIQDTPIFDVIKQSRTIIEWGCGTGLLSVMLTAIMKGHVIGIDISQSAINFAMNKYGSICDYYIIENIDDLDIVDLIVSSNTLEHFINYTEVLESLFTKAPKILLIIPYKDSSVDPNAENGGLHHMVSFDESSFSDYHIIYDIKYKSDGWENGVNPQQWAVLLEKVLYG